MNGTRMPKDYNYDTPPNNYEINGQNQLASQYFTVEVVSVYHNSGLTTKCLGLVSFSASRRNLPLDTSF
jgi:hypothetical protein